MLKVLIVDDEEKICQLIQKLVDWDSLEMEVIDKFAGYVFGIGRKILKENYLFV